jgi:Ca-activated chloride channel family protein
MRAAAGIFSLILILMLQISHLTKGQGTVQSAAKKTRILFLLDASGSMLAKMENNSRMDVAKKLLAELVDSLATEPNLELALRVYGHQFDRAQLACTDTKLEVPFKPGNSAAIKMKLRGIIPKGNTPIAYSLEQSGDDFPVDKNTRNVIIIITDGIESCKGDPCAVALALQRKRVFLKPFVIGVGSDHNFAQEFACLGHYFDANSADAFKDVLRKVIRQTLNKTTVSVELLDSNGKPTETNVNMSFVNNVTSEQVYDLVHYLDENGKTDVLDIDAVLSYDLIVQTIPSTVKKGIVLEGGEHNIIRIKAPQGYLNINQGPSEYKAVTALIKTSDDSETINVQPVDKVEKYLAGTYDIEILTTPRIFYNDVKVYQGKQTILNIPKPGVLYLNHQAPGNGSIYQVMDDGSQEFVMNLMQVYNLNLPMQPGNYKIVFRTGSSKGSKYTDVKTFSIKSGATTGVKLF